MTSLPSSESPSPIPVPNRALWRDLLQAADLFRALVASGMPAEKLNRVTLNQARIFTHLVRSRAIGRPVRVKSLARELDVSPAAASQAVDRLVAYGVLSRSPDPDDRRAVRLSFTPKGDNLLRNHERRAEDLLAALGGIASEADFAVFRRVLSRLAAALSARWDGYLETKASASPSESRV